MNTQPTRFRGATPILLLVGLVILAAGSVLVYQGMTAPQESGAPTPDRTYALAPADVPDPDLDRPDTNERTQTPDGPMPDDSVTIPAIGARASLVSLGFTGDGTLDLPTEVDQASHWDGSAPIDAADGSILVAGHVDDAQQGAGALYDLHAVQPGDAIYLTKNGVETRWKVVALQSVVKEQLPDRVFSGESGPRELHLVTCGGPIVTDANGNGTYLENVIATAVPF